MCKSGGSGLKAACMQGDFELLVACVLNEDAELQGVFMVPISKLVQENEPRMLLLHPPWSLPKQNSTREKYAWQSDDFLDLPTWHGSTELPDELQVNMERLISRALDDMAAKRHVEALSFSWTSGCELVLWFGMT